MTDSSPRARRVIVVVPDLLFATRIADTAKRLGIEALPSTPATALAACRASTAALAIIDLEAPGEPQRLIREIKVDPTTASIQVVCFYPHVRADLRAAAREAGADLVLPRSAFVARLSHLLTGDGGTVE